jgi:hypothetical protein
LDVYKLKNGNVKREFRTHLRNKYEEVINEEENKGKDESVVVEDSIENKWEKIKATLLTAGYKEKARKEWISVESWKLIEERRAIKQDLINTKRGLQDRLIREAYNEKNK